MKSSEVRLPASKLEDIRLVVCDMDGTALNREKEFSSGMLAAWSALRKAGIPYTIASARAPSMLGVFCAQAEISNIPVITLEGALVVNWPGGEVLYEHLMEEADAKRVMEYCHESGLDYTVYTARRAYLRRDTRRGWRFEKYNALADRYGLERVKTAVYEEFSPQSISREGVYKIFVDNPNDGCTEKLKRFLRGMARVRTDSSEGRSITVMHEAVSKGEALRLLLAHMGISKEQVCCFGDWYNDLDMLASCPHSVAMGNAVPEIKQAAGYVTYSNDDDGAAYFINQYLLK